jgi:hypothetical protein
VQHGFVPENAWVFTQVIHINGFLTNMAKQLSTERRYSLVKVGLCAASIAFSGFSLMGCDGGSGGGSSSAVKMEAKISGSVSNAIGPINEGKIEVKDNSGATVATTQITGSRYTATIPASASYPIVITAYPAEGAVSGDPVKAVVTSPIADRMDVSAVTTYVVDNAIALGGLTAENIAKASGGAIGMRQAQGVSAGAGGGGAGPGQSGGGAGKGGHAGHDMSDKSSGSSKTEGDK